MDGIPEAPLSGSGARVDEARRPPGSGAHARGPLERLCPPPLTLARLRCSVCGRVSALAVEPVRWRGDAGSEIRALGVLAVGVCAACGPDGPLARASLASLRHLTGYLACAAPSALEAAGLLPAGGARLRSCERLYPALAAVLRSPSRRRALDRALCGRLEPEASAFHPLALAELAQRLADEEAQWPRETLLAFLWSVARRGEAGLYATLERRVVRRLQARAGWPPPGGL